MGTFKEILSKIYLWWIIVVIFVSVGNHTGQFYRLFRELDKLKREGFIEEKILCQIGYTNFNSDFLEIVKFLSISEFNDAVMLCKVFITHGGCGSILTGIKYNHKPVVVPRLKKFQEHNNDHQLDLVRQFEKERVIIPVYDIKNLHTAINTSKKEKNFHYTKGTENVINLIESFVAQKFFSGKN